MKRFVVGMLAAAVLVSMAHTATAQVKTFDVKMRTETATIEAIDVPSRAITLKKPDGTFVTVVAGPDIKRFAEIKVGDKVAARYYENVVIRVKRPGEPDVDTAGKATTLPNRSCLVAPRPSSRPSPRRLPPSTWTRRRSPSQGRGAGRSRPPCRTKRLSPR